MYSKEVIRTGQSGQADLQFKDNSNLKVGSNSSVPLISSSTTRTNRPVLSPSKQRAARFGLWQDPKVVAPCRSRPLMALLACAVEAAPVHCPLIDILGECRSKTTTALRDSRISGQHCYATVIAQSNLLTRWIEPVSAGA